MKHDELPTISLDDLQHVAGGSNRSQLNSAMERARELGLRITSTTGGRHVASSFHYRGRAFDAAGSRAAMSRFFQEMAVSNPTELFYDPSGGVQGRTKTGAIGGHRNHVHLAY